MKTIHYLQFLFMCIFMFLLRLLGQKKASDLGARLILFLSRLNFIKAIARANKICKKNIQICLPHLTEREVNFITKQAWMNLGRLAGEITFLHKTPSDFFQIIDHSHGEFQKAKSAIILSAHYGNWETANKISHELGLSVGFLYRKINNPFIDVYLKKQRINLSNISIEKGTKGIREIIRTLNSGNHIAMLIDQRLKEGLEIDFFGKKCRSSSLPFSLAKKMGLNVFIMRFKRVNTYNFEVTISNAMNLDGLSEREATQKYYNEIESWIREDPSQYFWFHDRFRKHSS